MAVRLSRRAEADLRGLPRGALQRIRDGFVALDSSAANLDVKALKGRDPWLRLRVGDHRVLYRPIDGGHLVARIVNRRDLERAIETL